MKLRLRLAAGLCGMALSIVAACAAFGQGDNDDGTSSSSSSSSSSSGSTTSSSGGSGDGSNGGTSGSSGLSDGGTLPLDATIDGAGICTIIFDNFEADSTHWNAVTAAGSTAGRATVNPTADAGTMAFRFLTTDNTQRALLRRRLDERPQPPCGTILVEAWVYLASATNRPTILEIERKELVGSASIPSIKLVAQTNNMDVIVGSNAVASPTLANVVWHRIRLEYTRLNGLLRASIDANPFDSFTIGPGAPTRLDFGFLGGMAGNDDIYFDDVTLRH